MASITVRVSIIEDHRVILKKSGLIKACLSKCECKYLTVSGALEPHPNRHPKKFYTLGCQPLLSRLFLPSLFAIQSNFLASTSLTQNVLLSCQLHKLPDASSSKARPSDRATLKKDEFLSGHLLAKISESLMRPL